MSLFKNLAKLSIFIQVVLFATLTSSCRKEEIHEALPINNFIDVGLTEVVLWDPPSEAVYIDPNYKKNDSDGSIERPFADFKTIDWVENTVYAIRRGSVLETESILITKKGVTLASYGKGSRPVLRCSTDKHAVSTDYTGTDDITFRDLEIVAPQSISGLIIRDNSQNARIINLKIFGGSWGIRALNYLDNLLIENCEVYGSKDDGIFIKNSTNIEISHCFIHDVNKNWRPPTTPEESAAGDGIQFEACNNWHVHHNQIDRTDTGNKFCFISNNPTQNDGIFEYNYLSGPKIDGSSVYIGDGSKIIVRYNYIVGPSNSPIYTHSEDILVHHNIFANITGPLFASKTSRIYNNVFYKMPIAIQGGKTEAINNIYALSSDLWDAYKVKQLDESNNLHFKGDSRENSFSGDPAFVNALEGDFHLLTGSDCIDRGKNVGIYADIDGNPIPTGNEPDIGPYEYK